MKNNSFIPKTIAFIFAWALVSCNPSFEAPEFVEIKNGRITHVSPEEIEIEAVGVMYNPNPVTLELQAIDLAISLDEKTALAQIEQTTAVTMPAKAEFEFPIKTYAKPSELYGHKGETALNQALKILLNREFKLHYQGSATVAKGVYSLKIPIVDSLLIPIKL